MKRLLVLACLTVTACGSAPDKSGNLASNAVIIDENVEEAAMVVPPPANEAIGNESLVDAGFVSPRTPTPILRIECRQGECYWEQIKTIEDVRSDKGEVLKKVTSRTGSSFYSTEKLEAPEAYDKSIKVDWDAAPRTAYVLCSKTRPTEARWDLEEETHLVTTLDVVNPGGYEVSGTNFYLQVCHGIAPGSASEEQVKRLGYGAIKSDQRQLDTLDEVMAFLK
jgi:hypothetical protein